MLVFTFIGTGFTTSVNYIHIVSTKLYLYPQIQGVPKNALLECCWSKFNWIH